VLSLVFPQEAVARTRVHEDLDRLIIDLRIDQWPIVSNTDRQLGDLQQLAIGDRGSRDC
jgi:hypothetical protein